MDPAGIVLTDIDLIARMFIIGVVGIAAADVMMSHQTQFMIAGGRRGGGHARRCRSIDRGVPSSNLRRLNAFAFVPLGARESERSP